MVVVVFGENVLKNITSLDNKEINLTEKNEFPSTDRQNSIFLDIPEENETILPKDSIVKSINLESTPKVYHGAYMKGMK